jgi:hypothetical protein
MMKAILILAALTIPVVAQDAPVQYVPGSFVASPSIAVKEGVGCVEAFPDLPRIAERLDVKPIDKFEPSLARAFVLRMCDLREFDFFEIINAFLDKLEKLK